MIATTDTPHRPDEPPGPQLAARMAERLRAALPAGCQAEVIDESAQHAGHAGANGSGWGTHFRVQLAGAPLQALPRIARHRLVYDALRDFIDRDGVHALAIEVRPPAA